MMTKKELTSYKKILGKNWSRKVLDYFNEKEYKRESGKDFILQDILNFFNGRYSLYIHIKVLEAVAHYKIIRQQLEEQREQLISENKKPEGEASGNLSITK